MFTGCRKNEIALARAEQFDRERGVLILPDSKTGERVVTLSSAAIEVLGGVPSNSTWLIPGVLKGEPVRQPYYAWRQILKDAEIKNLRIHDLRHLFGTTSHHMGANLRTVAQLLGHKQLATAERYTHGMDEGTRAAANKTADALRTMLG
jgi:integrase